MIGGEYSAYSDRTDLGGLSLTASYDWLPGGEGGIACAAGCATNACFISSQKNSALLYFLTFSCPWNLLTFSQLRATFA